ncbi:Gfo/Idh/MocA family oxidoreductase [Paenibacillus sp. LHD-38]|uniref:Gfo/Idh/MocA family protein n=1 Tax=Paenibacillus sp. LHD-38 TaxID=3072143 RepID=UPI002810760A|nr:Gfo/Idh/MocA family oxidoreductase [Paenibacillus sp. LHD-38]MDQ8735759.1 Gfo/Idh/MocA family oxidoreductase [Paenibacillus sp. LHD-38]
MQPVRIALIGCGYIAQKHVRSLLEIGEEVELVALCDIDKQQLERFAKDVCKPHYPNIRLHTTIEECLSRDDIDLIAITTSSHTHAAISIAALQAGKHVLVEKPLALSIQDARLAEAEAKQRGLILAVSLQTRYLSQMQAIKKATDEGRFGRLIHGVVSMRWNRNMDYYHASPWRESWAKGGGLFMNQCIHYIDLLQWLMGPVVSVYGEADTFAQPLHVENMGVAVLKFANGATGNVEASACVYPKSLLTSLSLFGERGSVSLEGVRLNELKQWNFENDQIEDESVLERTDEISHTPLYKDMIQAITTGTSPLVSVETSIDSLEVILAIYKSIKEGVPVHLPLDHFDMKNMTLISKGGDPH